MTAAPHTASRPAIITCDNLVKIYKAGAREVLALQGLDLTVAAGEMIGIVGKSGSGKSTLLNILGGNDVPTAGMAEVAGYNLLTMPAKRLAAYRRHVVGVVWQQTARNLLPYLTAIQNVEHPLYYAGAARKAARRRAAELLEMVGLGDRLRHTPADLSGGEQQRVAIAIALANRPRVVLADEPTGELDTVTAREILGVLKMVQQQAGVTVVVVTHDQAVADVADRTIAIRDGRTSAERLRVARAAANGAPAEVSHEEYVVVDRTGRLQIPQEYLRVVGIDDRAVLRLDEGRIVVEPVGGPQARRPIAPAGGMRGQPCREEQDAPGDLSGKGFAG